MTSAVLPGLMVRGSHTAQPYANLKIKVWIQCIFHALLYNVQHLGRCQGGTEFVLVTAGQPIHSSFPLENCLWYLLHPSCWLCGSQLS